LSELRPPKHLDATALPVVRTVAGLRRQVGDWRRTGETIGIVPTMGALHRGHVALVDRARQDCRRTIATLFVNPLQFNATDDFKSYPREEEADRRMFASAGVDLLFAPTVDEVYPAGFDTSVSVGALARPLCGATRPGHFQGVATVVTKLLLITQPDRAYFGEKDYQQLLVIRRLAADLNIPVEIVGCPTVREADVIYQKGRFGGRVVGYQIDDVDKEVRFDEITNTDELLLPDEFEFQRYILIVRKVAYATKVARESPHKGRILRGVVAEIVSYREH